MLINIIKTSEYVKLTGNGKYMVKIWFFEIVTLV